MNNSVEHVVYIPANQQPSVALSACFPVALPKSPQSAPAGSRPVRITITVEELA